MELATYSDSASLYRARGGDVNLYRPLFTGDVFRDIGIPGLPGTGLALVIAHPCSFRGGEGRLGPTVLVARVQTVAKEGASAWASRFYDKMPLPDLDGPGYWAGLFDSIGLATSEALLADERVACLSDFGVNMLQQRLTCSLTRAKIPTQEFNRAFSHTYEEAELLEDWTSELCGAGDNRAEAERSFDEFMREGDPSRRKLLEDPQHRHAVRQECRKQIAYRLGRGQTT